MNSTIIFEKISGFTGINIISWTDLIPYVIGLALLIAFIYTIIKKKRVKKTPIQPVMHEDIFQEDNKLVIWQQNALQTELYRIKETGKALEQNLLQKKNELQGVWMYVDGFVLFGFSERAGNNA